jgi:hypothetical protein
LILFEILHHARDILLDHHAGRRKGLLRRCELWLDAVIDLHAHLYISPSENLAALYAAVIDAEKRVLAIETNYLWGTAAPPLAACLPPAPLS